MSTGWLTVKQAAAELGGVSDKLIYKLFHLGELEGVKIAGTVRIRAASVATYLETHSNRKVAADLQAPPSVPPGMPSKTGKTRRRPRCGGNAFIHIRPQS